MSKKKKSKKKIVEKTSEYADVDQRRFIKFYKNLCEDEDSDSCRSLIKSMMATIEKQQYLTKFIVCGDPDSNISLEPVIRSVRESFYDSIEELHVWDIELNHRMVAAVALLLERRAFKIRLLELMDCGIMAYSLKRLSQAFSLCYLVHLNLDYNEFGDDGCNLLCEGCKDNKTLLSLSMCYCKITSKSGLRMGQMMSSSLLRELYIDGNKLECDGMMMLLTELADSAEEDHEEQVEDQRLKELMIAQGALQVTDRELNTQMEAATSGNESSAGGNKEKKEKKKKKKKGKKGGKKKLEPPPIVGPYIDVLHVSDNGIDLYNEGASNTLLPCVSLLQRLIMYSRCLRELDISRNPIRETSAKELLCGLEQRKEHKYPTMSISVAADFSKSTFNEIYALAGALKNKKKKGSKKKRKKKTVILKNHCEPLFNWRL